MPNGNNSKNSNNNGFQYKLTFLDQFRSVSAQDKLFFVENLGVMIKAGISLSKALHSLAQETSNTKFKKILLEARNNIEKGMGLAESLKPHKNIFGEYFINMIETGESSGKFETVLNQLYIQIKKDYDLKNSVRNAMIYPSFVIFIMLVVLIAMLVFIMPQLIPVFNELGIQLPLPTRMIIAMSNFFVAYKYYLLAFIIVLAAIIFLISRTKKGKYLISIIALKTPIAKNIVKKINLARFCRTFSSLIQTDIPITKSFEITANVLSNQVYKKSLSIVVDELKRGRKIRKTLEKYPKLFTPLILEMISVGEDTGSLDTILEKLASFYEGQIDQIMKNIPVIIEPVLIVILGVGAGFLGVAVIMPIYTLAENL